MNLPKFGKCLLILLLILGSILYWHSYENKLVKASESAVSIYHSERWHGSGVIIFHSHKTNKTYILTAKHVLGSNADTVVIRQRYMDGVGEVAKYSFSTLLSGPDIDLALIVVDGIIGRPSLLSDGSLGEVVYSMASYDAWLPVWHKGKITGIDIDVAGDTMDRHSASTNLGHSGSGIFNNAGKVVGIVCSVGLVYLGNTMFPIPALISDRAYFIPTRTIKTWLISNNFSWILQ